MDEMKRILDEKTLTHKGEKYIPRECTEFWIEQYNKIYSELPPKDTKPDVLDELHAFELLQKEGSLELRSISLILKEYQQTGKLGVAIENEQLRVHNLRFPKEDASIGKPLC